MSAETETPSPRPRHQLASGGPLAWRTVDFVVLAVLGVAIGVVFWGWDQVYTPIGEPLAQVFPPLAALIYGVWSIGTGVGALLVRRPGAAVFTEVVAASVEYLLGNKWSISVYISALLYGLGVELIAALLRWRRWDLLTVGLGLGLGSIFEGIYETRAYYSDWSPTYKIVLVIAEGISGLVVGGGLSWLIVKSLATTGALQAFPPGREQALAQGEGVGAGS